MTLHLGEFLIESVEITFRSIMITCIKDNISENSMQ